VTRWKTKTRAKKVNNVNAEVNKSHHTNSGNQNFKLRLSEIIVFAGASKLTSFVLKFNKSQHKLQCLAL